MGTQVNYYFCPAVTVEFNRNVSLLPFKWFAENDLIDQRWPTTKPDTVRKEQSVSITSLVRVVGDVSWPYHQQVALSTGHRRV